MPIIQDVFAVLAFALLVGGQFAAVIAVHRLHKGEAARRRLRHADVSDGTPRPQGKPHFQPA